MSGTYKCFSQMLLIMERYPTLRTSDSWKLVHKPRLEPSRCNYTQQQLYLFAVSGRARGRVVLVAQFSVVIVPLGRNSELSSSLSRLLCLHRGHQLQRLPASRHRRQVLSLEVTACCCHRHVKALGSWASCSPSSTAFHGVAGLARESICQQKGRWSMWYFATVPQQASLELLVCSNTLALIWLWRCVQHQINSHLLAFCLLCKSQWLPGSIPGSIFRGPHKIWLL